MWSLNRVHSYIKKDILAQDFDIFLSNSVEVKSLLISSDDNTVGDAQLDDKLLFSRNHLPGNIFASNVTHLELC